MINHDALKKALKTMTTAPKEIEIAEQAYKAQMADIEARSRDLSPNYKDRLVEEARDKRDLVIGNLMEQMGNAIQTIDDNNSFENEALDISDPKLTNAITILNTVGADMDANTQLSILESFRGNPAALKFLGTAFKKNGLYFADRANEMVKPIPKSALEDAARVIGTYEYNGEVNLDGMTFSKGEFKKQSERMGYDLSASDNPYAKALKDEKARLSQMPETDNPAEKARISAAQMRLALAIEEIQSGNKGNPADIFAKAIASLERNEEADQTNN